MPQRHYISLPLLRTVRLTDVPPGHKHHGVTFAVIQEPTPENPYLYVRRMDTGEVGFFEVARLRETFG